MSTRAKESDDILLYIPNLIGYARLCFLLLAYFCIQIPEYFIPLYVISVSLDLFDGWAARKFNQCSAFGAWLDVIVDNVSRSCIWTNVFQWGWIVSCIEWTTFVGNHQLGAKWREENANYKPHKAIEPPKFVVKIMENGFKTPLGTWVISGLHCLPIWIYAMQNGITDMFVSYYTSVLICLILAGGRLMCLACELWCIKKHVIELLYEDLQSN